MAVDKKKAAAAAAVATIFSASSTAVEANFDDPADLLQSTNVEPKVQHIDMDDVQENPDADQDSEKQKGKAETNAFREFILCLPLAVRYLFVLPMWFLGNAIVYGASILFAGASPILQWILSFAVLALIIAGAFAVTAKAIFPDLPLKKIFNRHTIKWLLIGTAAVYAADLVLGVTWAGYAQFKTLIMGIMTLIVLCAIVTWFMRWEKRRRARLEAKALAEQKPESESDELVIESLGETFVIKK